MMNFISISLMNDKKEGTMGMDKEEELVRTIKILAGTTLIPLRVAVDVIGSLSESIENYLPEPPQLASDIIDLRISALKAINNAVAKEIELLEKYKAELKGAEVGKKEKVKVD